MDLKGYSAWITVDGTELKQYNVEISPEGNKASCWIPSEAGKASNITYVLCSVDRHVRLTICRNLLSIGGIQIAQHC